MADEPTRSANEEGPTDDRREPDSASSSPAEPRLRLVRTTFTRLSSGFRVPEPPGGAPAMGISRSLSARLSGGAFREAPPPAAESPSAIDGVLSRMRALAEVADAGRALAAASYERGQLVAELRAEVEGIERARRSGDAVEPLQASVAPSLVTMQRLIGSIARARAIEGNLAAARSDLESVSQAEEALVLARAQALLEEGVARFTQGTPVRPKLRVVLN